jgi:hypothetical protein
MSVQINIPKETKIESQPRPKVNKEKMEIIKQAKDLVIKTNQIIKK